MATLTQLVKFLVSARLGYSLVKSFMFVIFSLGNYSTVTATFLFHRRIGYYLIQAYFPSIFVVVLSWIVFWMDKEGIGDRITLGITSILTIMFLLGSLNGNLPKVSYPKALDWYLLASFSFVFLTLIECTIVFLFVSSAKQDEEHIAYKVTYKLTQLLNLTFSGIFLRKRESNFRPPTCSIPLLVLNR